MVFTRRSGWALISAFVLSMIAWNFDVPNIYLIASFSIALLLVSLVHFIYSIGSFKCEREIINVAHEDDVLGVKLDLKNLSRGIKKFFQLNDLFPAEAPDEGVISLMVGKISSGESAAITYEGLCYKRGLYKIGPAEVIFQDSLGLFRKVKKLNVISPLLVYPKVFNIKYFPELVQGSREWFGLETARTSGESFEFYGIREYQRQDGLRRIHWKSSARLGSLTAKQFEKSVTAEATIVLDLKKSHNIGRGKDTPLEYSVKIAASISRYLLLEQQSIVQLIGYGKDFVISPFNKGDFGYHSVMEYLAQVEADGEHDMADVLGEAAYITGRNSTLIVFLLDKDEAAMEALSQFKTRGIEPVVFIFDSDSFFDSGVNDSTAPARIFPELMGLGVTIYYISCKDDLQAKFEVPS